MNDFLGMDIYLKEGTIGNGPIVNKLHQKVCVDLWDCVNTQEPQKKGIKCYSFGRDYGDGVIIRIGARFLWLGWYDYVLGGVLLKGEIYPDASTPGEKEIKKKKTTPQKDYAWNEMMRKKRKGVADVYSLARHNCRKYSQQEFEDA